MTTRVSTVGDVTIRTREPRKSVEITQFELPTGNYYGPVNAFLLRVGDEMVLVDTGPITHTGQSAVRQLIENGYLPLQKIDRVFLTHHHWDHVGGSLTVPGISDLPHIIFRQFGADVMKNYDEYKAEALENFTQEPTNNEWIDYFKETVYNEWGELHDVNIDRVVSHNESVDIGDTAWRIIHTPGHDSNHSSLYNEQMNLLFLGDFTTSDYKILPGPTTTSVTEFDQTLSRLEQLEPEEIYFGHDTVVSGTEARTFIKQCNEKHQERIEMITDAVDSGYTTVDEITAECFGSLPPLRAPWIKRMVDLYLDYLFDGTPSSDASGPALTRD